MRCIACVLFVLCVLIFSCNKRPAEQERVEEPAKGNTATASRPEMTGAQLARTHCAGCHQFPDPGLLDKNSWEKYVLPRMGNYFGIYHPEYPRERIMGGGRAGQMVEKMNVFPVNRTLDTVAFNQIKQYYLDEAPKQLPRTSAKNIAVGLKNFEVRKPTYKMRGPMTSLVKFSDDNGIYISDVGTSTLSMLGSDMKISKSIPAPQGVTWIHEDDHELYALVVGTFNPTDLNLGYLMRLQASSGADMKILIQGLQRPVHVDFGDLDGDGLEDIVIAEFGNHTGALSWWKQDAEGNYERNVLRNQPGATKAYIRDLNGDGKPDVIALFGQGDEGIFVYYNQGEGQFIEENVLRFPASYGSSYFNLFDFNGDGHEDIIYTAGDNADYDPVLKPYHGIRIFENDGANQFNEKFFYPLNGAYHAIPMDFDLDGDIDIAAISFFPDYENSPEESFVYLENKGDLNFEASTFPGSSDGRWIVMDAGDFDGDGDMDLILGSMIFGTDHTDYFDKWVENGLPFIILENTTK